MKAAFIPARPGELTPQWVGAALREAGAVSVGEVVSISIEALNAGGVGLTGETVRVRLVWAGASEAPLTVVAKFPAPNRETRAMVENFDAYAREIRFYQRFADRVPVRTARYLGADFDPGRLKQPGPVQARVVDALPAWLKVWVSKNVTQYMRPTKRRYALLLEDLGAAATVHDVIQPPDDDQVGAALECLAAVHAEFWADPSLAGNDAFATMVTTTPALFSTVALRRCLPAARARYDWLGAHEAAVLERAIARFRDNLRVVNQPMTLVHGDARSDNIMFCPDGEVVLLDWALVGNAHPGWDVGYLLSSCLDESRIGSFDRLIEQYENRLGELGVNANSVELRRGIDAAYGCVAVQQLLSLSIFDGRLDETDNRLSDHWLPRVVAGLRR